MNHNAPRLLPCFASFLLLQSSLMLVNYVTICNAQDDSMVAGECIWYPNEFKNADSNPGGGCSVRKQKDPNEKPSVSCLCNNFVEFTEVGANTTTVLTDRLFSVEQDFDNPDNLPMRNFNAQELKDLFGIDYVELCNNVTIAKGSCLATWDSVRQCSKDEEDGFCCTVSFNGGEGEPMLPIREKFDCSLGDSGLFVGAPTTVNPPVDESSDGNTRSSMISYPYYCFVVHTAILFVSYFI